MCFDGGFSNDSPCLDSYTITVSALHRKADIKPAMDPLSMDTIIPDTDSTSTKNNDDGTSTSSMTENQRNRIRAMDIIRTPTFERVWQVGSIGEVTIFCIVNHPHCCPRCNSIDFMCVCVLFSVPQSIV